MPLVRTGHTGKCSLKSCNLQSVEHSDLVWYIFNRTTHTFCILAKRGNVGSNYSQQAKGVNGMSWNSSIVEDDEFDGFECDAESQHELRPDLPALPRGNLTFEGVLGLLAAFFIGLPAPFLVIAAALNLFPGNLRWLGIGLAIGAGYLSLLVVRLAARATEGDDDQATDRVLSPRRFRDKELVSANEGSRLGVVPLAIAMAIRLPNWPLVFRPFIGLWWLAHFGAAAFLGHLVAAWAAKGLNNAAWFVSVPLTLLATFAFLFAGNLYLILSVATCINRPSIWLIVWRHRFLLDLLLASFLLFAGT